MYQSGDIVVVDLPYTDLTTTKVRPVFIITKLQGEDLIVCQVSSQLPKSYEVAVKLQNSDLTEGSLKFDSYIRADKIFTIAQNVILSKIGRVKLDKLREVKQAIIGLLS